MLLLVLLAFSLRFSLAEIAFCGSYPEKLDRSIRKGREHRSSQANSAFQCLIWSCGCHSRCIASFHEGTGVCRSISLGNLPYQWLKSCPTFATNDSSEWTTFLADSSAEEYTRPAGLWVLDNAFRACNLGRTGQTVTLREGGLKYLDPGPGQATGARFARFHKNIYPLIRHKLQGSSIFNFNKPFVIALWVRMSVHQTPKALSLLNGWNDKAFRSSIVLTMERKKKDAFYFNHYRELEASLEKSTSWRHISWMFFGKKMYFFSADGKFVDLTQSVESDVDPIQPTDFFIGYIWGKEDFRFFGNMACISIYERIDRNESFDKIRKSCP